MNRNKRQLIRIYLEVQIMEPPHAPTLKRQGKPTKTLWSSTKSSM